MRTVREYIRIFADYWSTVFYINGLFFLFCLPTAVWLILTQCYSSLLVAASEQLGGLVLLTMLGMLPCAIILSVGMSGVLYCYKQLFFEKNGAVRKNFNCGVKENAGKYILFGSLMWLALSLSICSSQLYQNITNGILLGVCIGICVVFTIISLPVLAICATECVFYKDTLKDIFANAVKIYFISPFWWLLDFLVIILPFAVVIFLPLAWQMAGWVLMMIAGVAVCGVFWLHRSKKRFDKIMTAASRQ